MAAISNPCPICYELEDNGGWTTHPGNHSLAHRVHTECFKAWYVQRKDATCLFKCDEHYPVSMFWKERSVSAIKKALASTLVGAVISVSIFLTAGISSAALQIVASFVVGVALGIFFITVERLSPEEYNKRGKERLLVWTALCLIHQVSDAMKMSLLSQTGVFFLYPFACGCVRGVRSFYESR